MRSPVINDALPQNPVEVVELAPYPGEVAGDFRRLSDDVAHPFDGPCAIDDGHLAGMDAFDLVVDLVALCVELLKATIRVRIGVECELVQLPGDAGQARFGGGVSWRAQLAEHPYAHQGSRG
ncbi:MAG: hypothetical protein Q7T71_15920 [Herbiconiux sp.]|nr:hypothetical protein [Herbiconiux sp.]